MSFLLDYFIEEPNIKKYVSKALEASFEGHSAVVVDEADLTKLKEELKKTEWKDAIHLNEIFFQLQKFRYYEQVIEQFVKKRIDLSVDTIILNASIFSGLIKRNSVLFNTNKSEMDFQDLAIFSSFLYPFSIISGGPGTGKTSSVAKLIYLLISQNHGLKITLTAQTGKAAARLKESLDESIDKLKGMDLNLEVMDKMLEVNPLTIHRLLGYKHKSVHFKHNNAFPLPYDVVIVDESSMVDLPMMAKLMDAIGDNTKLILLGDAHQLPSVELGAVFKDLCGDKIEVNYTTELFSSLSKEVFGIGPHTIRRSRWIPHIQLQKSHRFKDSEGIGLFSKAILNQDKIHYKEWQDLKVDEQGVQCFSEFDEEFFTSLIISFKDFINESDPSIAIDKLLYLRVLVSSREGKFGLKAINTKIEHILFDKGLINVKDNEFGYYEHRPIMIVENDYNLELFNGDVGVVKKDSLGKLKAYFKIASGEVKAFDLSLLKSVETVFAMTIHKSQGSQFEKVILLLPEKSDSKILGNELIYTAVTRAKKQVYIFGKEEILNHAVQEKFQRLSCLRFND